ncbi:hypothetical protein IIA15_08175 [candidate division TA06 bacterium]|nr:hypothetical protein [candidate division TA06 bacterium]
MELLLRRKQQFLLGNLIVQIVFTVVTIGSTMDQSPGGKHKNGIPANDDKDST